MSSLAFCLALIVVANWSARAQSGPDIDVRAFHPACDGVTNDAPALQAALNMVSAGGSVLIPCKLGIGAEGVRLVNKSRVSVRGIAPGAGLKSLARTTQGVQAFGPVLFVVLNCSNCTIRDLEFDGNGMDVAPLGLDQCTETTVENNNIFNVGVVSGGALVGAGNKGNRYLGNTITKTANHPTSATRGMWIGNPSPSEIEFSPQIVRNVLRDIGATGIAVHATEATVRGNLVENTQGAGLKLVTMNTTGPTVVVENVLRRNLFHGIQVEWARNVTICGNTVEQNKGSGIYSLFGLSNSLICGNIIRDNNFNNGPGGSTGGIWVSHAENSSIVDNQIYDTRTGSQRSQDNAIIIAAGSRGAVKNLKIGNNVCSNHTANGISLRGEARGAVSGITLAGNVCTNNSQYGLLIRQQVHGAIAGLSESDNTFAPNSRGSVWAIGEPPLTRWPAGQTR